jgi:hypothetical protein
MTQAALAPTPERINRQRESYQPPSRDQKTDRPYGQFRPWFETLSRKADIPGPSILAASDLDLYWRQAHDARGITCSYGDQRWSTPIAHMSMEQLLKPERRELAHQRLKAARAAVAPREWDALECMIKRDDGDLGEAGRYLGAASDRWARELGSRLVKNGLHTLARHWGYVKHDPGR